MLAKREKNKSDSQIKFSANENSGVLIQHQLKRAIYYVRGEVKDDFFFESETPAIELDKWVKAKRKLYESAQN